jgi:hypothetical protein
MNSDQFVDGIYAAVYKSAINTVLKTLANPPGRQPRRYQAELSSWYNSLADEDKQQVANVIREAVDQTVFGMLAVLDGVRTIDDEHSDLYLRTGDGTLLNDPAGNELHAIFRATVDDDLLSVDDRLGGP